MYQRAAQRLAGFVNAGHQRLLKAGQVGLEKECLRVEGDGKIAQTPHPADLGSALTNPYITTDYSEALLEFITPPFAQKAEALAFLREVQQFVYRQLGDEELLWATSMPCVVAGEESVPIASYGSSNIGQMKTVYRRGLGHRYGRVMQVIAGVHFNYSFSEDFWRVFQVLEEDGQPLQAFISDYYFGLLRNLQRVGWLIPYLFGASPAVCKSFLAGHPSDLKEFDESTYYGPYATSLRMGDIGYQNNKENEIGVKACYDSLCEYVDALTYAITTSYPGYEKIGVKVDGEYRQLNSNILQIENEYYSTVRPKQILHDNEKPTLALKRRGVRYVELRSLDINAFEPMGVNETQLYFLEALMLFCLLHDSPRIAPWERVEIDKNELRVAHHGRKPGLQLQRNGEGITLTAWAGEILEAMTPICTTLDEGETGSPYSTALARQKAAVADPDLTPSARMLREMRHNNESFYRFARRKSHEHRDWFATLPVDAEQMRRFAQEAEASHQRQREIEAGDRLSFDEYLQHYFAQS